MLNKRNEQSNKLHRIYNTPSGNVQILEYHHSQKKYFLSLNREWLEEYFEIELEDERILSDPEGYILKNGGAIYFAQLNKKIVGTCALISHESGTLELAKMAVTKKAQGYGIGRLLALAVIEHARRLGANALFLQTSPKLEAANRLYRKLGFKKIKNSPFTTNRYRRSIYTMKLNLKK
jgi:GNAT superfamily N-acetyltransferase